MDPVRPGVDAQRPQVGRLHLGRADRGRGAAGQMQSRAAAEQGGEEEAAAGHGQVPLRARNPGADPGGGVQRGLRGAAQAAAHVAPGQETLQDRDPQTGYLLHLLPEPRVGCLSGSGRADGCGRFLQNAQYFLSLSQMILWADMLH